MRLAVIPARGGSKGLPRKNILPLVGKPLIAWSIESAINSAMIDRVVVSTDDPEIAQVAEKFGAQFLMRPANLASDEATTISVLTHVAEQVPEATLFVVLQPTSPLRGKTLVDDCIKSYETGAFSNLATGYWCKFQEFGSHNNKPRQEIKGFFYDDGSVYILPRNLVEQGCWFGDNICRFITARRENYEIDDDIDFIILDSLIRNTNFREMK